MTNASCSSRASVARELVEPGYGPTTRFTSNTAPRMEGLIPAYAPFAQRVGDEQHAHHAIPMHVTRQ